MSVRTGLEVLLSARRELIAARRVGLITHPAATLPDFTSVVDALLAAGVKLTALYGMEHGLTGAAADGSPVRHGIDARTGLPVFSLYGATQAPTSEMLANVEVLLFDVQDVGVRFYTFISTLFHVLRAAGQFGRPVIVLDRPNPIDGLHVEGPLLQPGFESFVGVARLPIRHGLTIAELARWFNREYQLGADLTVVAMQGWQRHMRFDATGLPWIPTSPAMPHLSTATVYPGACLLEGTNLSEGRGTALPFEQCGAPWVDGYALARALNALHLPGIWFRPTSFQPSVSKHAGQVCGGVQWHVTNMETFRPVSVALHLITTLLVRYPDQFEWTSYERADSDRRYHFDALMGTNRVRLALDLTRVSPGRASARDLISDWSADEAEFRQQRLRCLIYTE